MMFLPTVPKGTRDFSPDIMAKRRYIFDILRRTFEKFGYLPLETPAMENLETLTGKYGDEGDQLIYKILNNGDFLKNTDAELLQQRDAKKLVPVICDRALRYDLTVPLARYVAMNHRQMTFPFRRYQMQPVWRADRPQKGRYREFYQCDADVIGSHSLLNDVELIQLYDEALSNLHLPAFTIHLNHRQVLNGIAEVAGVTDRVLDMTVTLDKWEKIGEQAVLQEWQDKGFQSESIAVLQRAFSITGDTPEKITQLSALLATSEAGSKGIEALRYMVSYITDLGLRNGRLLLDLTLARGLNYYTGTIVEVTVDQVQMGSIGGGGRYDNLTGIFGLPGMSGVGISFGADRIFDVMNELQLFPTHIGESTRLLFVNFGAEEEKHCLQLLKKIRNAGIAAEIYPEAVKLKKQFKYADDKAIPFVASVGSEEMKTGLISVKNMASGEQKKLSLDDLIAELHQQSQ